MTDVPPKDPPERRTYIPLDATLKDLWDAVPARVVMWLVGTLVTSFMAGFAVSELDLLGRLSRSLDEGPLALNFPQNMAQQPQTRTELHNEADRLNEAWAHTSPEYTLRQQHEVRLLGVMENDLPIDRVPLGRFGYVYSTTLMYYARGNYDFVRLRRSPDERSFEVHKASDGKVWVIAFASSGDALAIADPSRERREVELFSKPQRGTTIVAVPADALETVSVRRLADDRGEVAEVILRPAHS